MSGPKLEPGEFVSFVDADEIQWGPWLILRALNDEVLVLIDGLVTYSVPRTRVRKVNKGKGENWVETQRTH